MSKRKVSGIMLMLLLASMLPLASEIQPVKAIGTIYIRADGSIDPPTAPIQRDEDVYTLTGNITGSESAIVIGRDDMILNGAGYAVQGTGVFNSIGISLLGRYNVTIKSMKIVSFDMGVLLNEGSAYNNIAENIITANNEGILLYDFSFSNNISGNSITHNNLGIGQLGMTEFPSNNVLRNNSMVNNTCNFSIDGLHLLNFLNDIDVSNTVDGRPIYYWVNKLDMVVPLNAGYVALINCTRITVQNLTLTKNGQGILLASTTNSTITKNSIANNDKGIRLRLSSSNNSIFENNITANDHEGILLDYGSSNSSISRNNVTANGGRGIFLESSYSIVSGNSITSNNQQGIFFYHSSHISISGNNVTANRRGGICDDYSSSNSISGNKIAANDRYGIEVVLSSDNSIYGNDLTDNEIGIYLYESSNNFIYHNNFINNTKQVYDYSWDHPSIPPSINSWDDGYPSGGNHWSDYADTDLYSGPYQNETGSDGIGDTPYVIDSNNMDNFPLMKRYPWASHDIGITSVTTSRNVVGQGYYVFINAMMFNYGNYTETFAITLYANETIIGKISNIDLASRNFTIVSYTLNTAGFATGTYTISAYIEPVPDETDIVDNRSVDGIVDIVPFYIDGPYHTCYGTEYWIVEFRKHPIRLISTY